MLLLLKKVGFKIIREAVVREVVVVVIIIIREVVEAGLIREVDEFDCHNRELLSFYC